MTFAETADHYAPTPELLGPYSAWPSRRNRGRTAKIAASVVAAGIFLHFTAPLLF